MSDLASDDVRTKAVLEALGSLMTYEPRLLDRMLATPALAELVPSTFAEAFDLFPAEALQRCITSLHIDQETLLWRLAATANPMHRSVHQCLIRRALAAPTDLHHLGYVASMLTSYSKDQVIDLLEGASSARADRWFWLVREVEAVRGERLIDEGGTVRR